MWDQCYRAEFLGGLLHKRVKDGLDDTLPDANQSNQSQMVNDEIVSPRNCFPKPTLDLILQLTGLLLVQLNGLKACMCNWKNVDLTLDLDLSYI